MKIIQIIDYTVWIVEALITLIISICLLRKLLKKGFKGFMIQLIWCIIMESLCTLVDEFTDIFGPKTSLFSFIISVAVGGEVAFKSITLWLFGVKYLKSSYEMPLFLKSNNGFTEAHFNPPT